MSWVWVSGDNNPKIGRFDSINGCLSVCKNQGPCDCAGGYCLTTSECKEHLSWNDKLLAALEGCDNSMNVAREVRFQFSGIELTLLPDGTYRLDDTTGG